MANRLSEEKSPYLRQHMNNPVDWYPWGDEAFEKAKSEDKPIFLSIGYSTCHWCHVMAHESFENEEAAEILNRDFVPVKVDREERPDIDAVYMRVCQMMTGSGGWPLTVIMTGDQRPFFAGTYFPTHSRYGRIGLVELLNQVSRRWSEDRSALYEAADQITSAIELDESSYAEPDRKLLNRAYRGFEQSFDRIWGGFGTAPKFPAGHNLLFLMSRKEPQAMEMVEKTLQAMAKGGIFDQIGGGFSRYSTDEKWLVPHFEKMLYDNALLIIAYANAFRLTKNGFYAEIARYTADYILNELQSPEGGIFSSQDADSEGVEGKYYIFTPREIKNVLGEKDGEDFCRLYGISDKNGIPNLISQDCASWGVDDERIKKLYEYRKKRTRLHMDNKILFSWNAWTVTAFAQCGQALSEKRYLKAAVDIQKFLERNMVDTDGRLYLRYCDGETANQGQLEDYGVYALALLELYRATFDAYYLYRAVSVGKQMTGLFEDENGGYFLTANDSEKLIYRPKETYDGAMPSGNSVAGMVLETLAQLTSDSFWRDAADRQMRFLSGSASEYPTGYAFALLAIEKAIEPGRELVVCSSSVPPELHNDLPRNFNVLYKSNENAELLAKIAPFTADYPVPDKGAMWYLCENGACQKPVSDFKELNI